VNDEEISDTKVISAEPLSTIRELALYVIKSALVVIHTARENFRYPAFLRIDKGVFSMNPDWRFKLGRTKGHPLVTGRLRLKVTWP
jgi:hypothetical protein